MRRGSPGGADIDEDRAVGAERVLTVLIALAEDPDGLTLDELTRAMPGATKPTVHRALASLRKLGLANQRGRGTYVLGDEFIRLAFLHQSRRSDVHRVTPLLESLTREFGETTHYATLDGDDVVYRAKEEPHVGAIRLTSTVGGRNPGYSTAVGKLLLADRFDTRAAALAWAKGAQLIAKTPATLVAPSRLADALRQARRDGYATDDQENEVGVNCVAVPVYLDTPGSPTGAISISGLTFRTPLAQLVSAVDSVRAIAAEHDIRTLPDPGASQSSP